MIGIEWSCSGQMFSGAAAMRDGRADRFEEFALSADDVDEIYALYMLSRSTTPHGFLAIRTRQDFERIFANPDSVLGMGIRYGGRLIGYSICHRVGKNPYPINPVLSLIDATTSNVYHGDGTVVDPAFQGRNIARRITRLRRQQLKERRIDHLFGLVAVDNVVSIGNATLAGGLLAGFARDDTALNFIVYVGRFRDRLPTDTVPISVGWRNHEHQRQLFSEGKVACKLTASNRSSTPETKPDRQLAFVPWMVHRD